MTAPAHRFAGGPAVSRRAGRAAGVGLLFFGTVQGVTPAAAQLAGTASLYSDYRYRASSLSGGDPALAIDLAYDDASGLYFNGAAFAAIGGGGPRLGGGQVNVGYARRLGPRLAVDAGLVQSHYRRAGASARAVDSTELYVGLSRRPISARIAYSPDDYGTGSASLYGEFELRLQPAPQWQLVGHVGALAYLDGAYASRAVQPDWQLAVERQLGALAMRAALGGGGGGIDLYAGRPRTRLVLVASWSY